MFAKYYTDEKLAQLVLTSGPLPDSQNCKSTSSPPARFMVWSFCLLRRCSRICGGTTAYRSFPAGRALIKLLFHLAVGKPLHPKYDMMFAGIAGRSRMALWKSYSIGRRRRWAPNGQRNTGRTRLSFAAVVCGAMVHDASERWRTQRAEPICCCLNSCSIGSTIG